METNSKTIGISRHSVPCTLENKTADVSTPQMAQRVVTFKEPIPE